MTVLKLKQTDTVNFHLLLSVIKFFAIENYTIVMFFILFFMKNKILHGRIVFKEI
jgi:hypothetical protein